MTKNQANSSHYGDNALGKRIHRIQKAENGEGVQALYAAFREKVANLLYQEKTEILQKFSEKYSLIDEQYYSTTDIISYNFHLALYKGKQKGTLLLRIEGSQHLEEHDDLYKRNYILSQKNEYDDIITAIKSEVDMMEFIEKNQDRWDQGRIKVPLFGSINHKETDTHSGSHILLHELSLKRAKFLKEEIRANDELVEIKRGIVDSMVNFPREPVTIREAIANEDGLV